MSPKINLLVGLVAVLFVISSQADPSGDAESPAIKSRPVVEYNTIEKLVLDSVYNKNIRPTRENNTETDSTVVSVNFFLRHVLSINEEAGILKVQLIFRQQWHDSRLRFHTSDPDITRIPVPEALQKEVWVPDTFFANEIDDGNQHKMLRPNSAIWIYPNGTVLSSNLMTLSLACPQVRYSREPSCNIQIESYAHTAKNVEFQWKEDKPIQIPEKLMHVSWDVKDMANNLMAKGYSLKKITPENCDGITPTSTWSCIHAVFQFRKNDVCST